MCGAIPAAEVTLETMSDPKKQACSQPLMRRPLSRLALLLLATVVSGCGGGDQRQPVTEPSTEAAVRSAYTEFMTASRGGDGETACRRLSAERQDAAFSEVQAPTCAERAEILASRTRKVMADYKWEIEGVTVDEDDAVVTVRTVTPKELREAGDDDGRDRIEQPMTRQDGRWIIHEDWVEASG